MTDPLSPLREGSYTNADGSVIAYLDAQTVQDARDLYAVLQEQAPSGSSNLENDQIRAILTSLQAGQQLDDAQWGAFHHLRDKYASALTALRASADRKGQDYSAVAEPGTGRVMKARDE